MTPDASRVTGDPLARAQEAVQDALTRLRDAGAPDEVVAERIAPRRILGVRRPDRLREVTRGWRLGVVLVTADGGLRATGVTFRSGEPAHSAMRSRIAEERLELQRAARRGRIPDGQTVNVGAPPIALEPDAVTATSAPLLLRDEVLLVRWARGADPAPFDRYLEEQVALHLRPPEGAGETPRR
ncbi:MAG: hypothetical protein HY996_08000 [Micrococcales bacterium]|nr:hypothetical protein [Micrococcales bacterium]